MATASCRRRHEPGRMGDAGGAGALVRPALRLVRLRHPHAHPRRRAPGCQLARSHAGQRGGAGRPRACLREWSRRSRPADQQRTREADQARARQPDHADQIRAGSGQAGTARDETEIVAAAVAGYRASLQEGRPLSERKLAGMFGKTSRRWARSRMAEARQSLAPAQEGLPSHPRGKPLTPGESGPSRPCQIRRPGLAARMTVVAVKRRWR